MAYLDWLLGLELLASHAGAGNAVRDSERPPWDDTPQLKERSPVLAQIFRTAEFDCIVINERHTGAAGTRKDVGMVVGAAAQLAMSDARHRHDKSTEATCEYLPLGFVQFRFSLPNDGHCSILGSM